MQEIELSKINVVYDTHKKPMKGVLSRFEKLKEDGNLKDYKGVIFVHNLDNGEFALLSNRLGFEIATIANQKFVNVEVLDVNSREEYFSLRMERSSITVDLEQITIPKAFAKTKPRNIYIKYEIDHINANGDFSSPIIVRFEPDNTGDEQLVLKDGYKKYLAAKATDMVTVNCLLIK